VEMVWLMLVAAAASQGRIVRVPSGEAGLSRLPR
jgi:hypothetical protein